MKKAISLCVALVLLLSNVLIVHAADVTLNLSSYYWYVHTNQTGTHYFKDSLNNTTVQGDATENDATFRSVYITASGKTANDRVYVKFSNGETQEITQFNTYVNLSNQNSKTLQIYVTKSGTNELYMSVKHFRTYDLSGGGTNVTYNVNGSTPTNYGSLGDGGSQNPPDDPPNDPPGNDPPIDTCTITLTLEGSVLKWDINGGVTSGNEIRIMKDGFKIVQRQSVYFGNQDISAYGSGSYRVEKLNYGGDVLCTSNTVTYITGDPGTNPEEPGEEPGTECNVCENLFDLVTCSAWNIVMGDITNAIRAALPPPPDWNYVASVMTSHIVPAMTADLLNYVVPAMADEIANRFGYAQYNGNPGVSVPTFTDYRPDENLPELKDLPNKIDFDLSDQSKIPEFEVVDATEKIVIPDPLDWNNPASTDRPEPNPNLEEEPRETIPSGEIEEPKLPIPSDFSGEDDPKPRDTTPRNDYEHEDDPMLKPIIPDGSVIPRTTIPEDMLTPRDITPTDWLNNGGD